MPPKSKSSRRSTGAASTELEPTRIEVNRIVESTIKGLSDAFDPAIPRAPGDHQMNKTAAQNLSDLEQHIQNVDTALKARQRWDTTSKSNTQAAIEDARATIARYESGKLTENLTALPSGANFKFPQDQVSSFLNFVRVSRDNLVGVSRDNPTFKSLFKDVKSAVDRQTIGPRLTSAAAKVQTSFEVQSQNRQDPSKKSSLFKDLVNYRDTIQQYSLYPTVPTKKDLSYSADSKKCYTEIRNILEKDTQKLGSIEPQSDDLNQLSRRVQHALLGLEKEMRAHKGAGGFAREIVVGDSASIKPSAATGAYLKAKPTVEMQTPSSTDSKESQLFQFVNTASAECGKLIRQWTKATTDGITAHSDLLSSLKPQIDAATDSMRNLVQAHANQITVTGRSRAAKRFASLKPSTAGPGFNPSTAFEENMGKLSKGFKELQTLTDKAERTFANSSPHMLELLESLWDEGAGGEKHKTASEGGHSDDVGDSDDSDELLDLTFTLAGPAPGGWVVHGGKTVSIGDRLGTLEARKALEEDEAKADGSTTRD